jgi:hypothetical protein
MPWLEDNLLLLVLGLIVTLLLTFDRLLSALGRIFDRLSLRRFRKWELARARSVLDQQRHRTALSELVMSADEIRAVAEHRELLERLAVVMDDVLSQVLPNGGDSLADKVSEALAIAREAAYGIDHIEGKIDRVLAELIIERERINDIDRRVKVME